MRGSTSAALTLAAAFFGQTTYAASNFHSRPELYPGELDVTKYEKDSVWNDGSIFLSVWNTGDLSSTSEAINPLIFDSSGKNLIWTGYSYIPNTVSNFTPYKKDGKTLVSYWNGVISGIGTGRGTYHLMGPDYRQINQLGLRDPFQHDFHEFHVLDNGKRAVFSTYQAIPYDLSTFNDSLKDGGLLQGVVTEVDTKTDEVLFQWHSIDHIEVSESMVLDKLETGKGTKPNEGSGFDYLHMNSIDKDDDGNYLISARHTWSLYYVNGTSGDLIWTMNCGNGTNNWSIDNDATFAYQHHARWVDPKLLGEKSKKDVKYISLFDNEDGGNAAGFRDHSRGVILKVQTYSNSTFTTKDRGSYLGKVTLFQEYLPKDGESKSTSQGSTQVLPNGNVFIGWGSNPAISEYKQNGDMIFHANLNKDRKYPTYRAFKEKWTGRPFERPAIVAKGRPSDGKSDVYMSWNGATEVKEYEVYAGNSTKNMKKLDKVQHKSFEDNYEADGTFEFVKVKALSSNGTKLGEYTNQANIMSNSYYQNLKRAEVAASNAPSSAAVGLRQHIPINAIHVVCVTLGVMFYVF